MSKTVLALLSEGPLQTDFGEFHISVFHDGLAEAITLTKGNVFKAKELLCRVHSHCVTAHVFNSTECRCREEMAEAQKCIAEIGNGIIIFLDQEGRGNGIAAHIATQELKKSIPPISQSEAYKLVGFPEDNRSYYLAAKILKYYEIQSIKLLTANDHKVNSLANWGIQVVKTRTEKLK